MKFLPLAAALLQSAWILCAATPDLVNGIAVIVGDSVITYKDIQLALQDDLQFLERQYGNQPQLFNQKAAELEKAKLDQLVESQLVLQEFKRAGYILPESYLENRIEEDIRRYGDRLTLTKSLQASGLTFETYRRQIRERVILQLMWQEKVPQEPIISPTKIENYYVQNMDKFKMEDQVRLRMIVLTNNPNNTLYSPKKVAAEIVGKLEEGVPFDELARIYSQGSQAAEGGDWGWIEKRVLREELAQAAFALEPGQHSGVVETPNGVYVMQVDDKKVSYTKSLSEVRDDIENTLRAEEVSRLRKQWINQLKEKSFVRYF